MFQGVTRRARRAEIRPPRLKSMYLGIAFDRSYAGETKLATMLIPTVAIAKVKAPMIRTRVFGILATTWTGSVMASPNTVREPEVTMTMTSEKAMKLIGNPQKLPR